MFHHVKMMKHDMKVVILKKQQVFVSNMAKAFGTIKAYITHNATQSSFC